jgi:hypothetical protein
MIFKGQSLWLLESRRLEFSGQRYHRVSIGRYKTYELVWGDCQKQCPHIPVLESFHGLPPGATAGQASSGTQEIILGQRMPVEKDRTFENAYSREIGSSKSRHGEVASFVIPAQAGIQDVPIGNRANPLIRFVITHPLRG